jgi:serine protease Do
MMRRIWIFFVIILLAGVSVGLASNGWPQEDNQADSAQAVRVWVGGGSYLGVHLDEVTSEAAQRLGLREERGALITEVVTDSPAAKAGLQKDDVIVAWNGARVESAMQLGRLVRETPSGRTVRLGVVRNGRETEMTMQLGKRSDYATAFKLDREARERLREGQKQMRDALRSRDFGRHIVLSERGRMGVTLQSLTPQLAQYFGLSGRSGALITSVREDSPAAKAGLKAGDVILSIGGETIDDPGDAMRIIRKKEEGPVEVRVIRDKQERTFNVELEKRDTSVGSFAFDDFEDIVIEPDDIVIPMPELEIHSQPLVIPMPKIEIPPIRIPVRSRRYSTVI